MIEPAREAVSARDPRVVLRRRRKPCAFAHACRKGRIHLIWPGAGGERNRAEAFAIRAAAVGAARPCVEAMQSGIHRRRIGRMSDAAAKRVARSLARTSFRNLHAGLKTRVAREVLKVTAGASRRDVVAIVVALLAGDADVETGRVADRAARTAGIARAARRARRRTAHVRSAVLGAGVPAHAADAMVLELGDAARAARRWTAERGVGSGSRTALMVRRTSRDCARELCGS